MEKIIIAGSEVLVDESERYIQLNDVNLTDICDLWKQIKIRYLGYDVMFCYHNAITTNSFLNEIGAILIDDNVEMRLSPENFIATDRNDVKQISESDFDSFTVYHDNHNPEMYWSSERIKKDLSRWAIFALHTDKRITGYILLALWNSEIFCVNAVSQIEAEALITVAAKFAFGHGKNELLFMADKDTIIQKAALAAGFRVTGQYKGYITKLL